MASATLNRTDLGARRLLDVPAAAECTGLPVRTVRNLFDTRALPVLKLGRSVRVWSDDLAAYLDANLVPAREAVTR